MDFDGILPTMDPGEENEGLHEMCRAKRGFCHRTVGFSTELTATVAAWLTH